MTMTADERASPGLYRLLAWLSPSFPTGAFSYSHGLEATVAGGAVCDRASLLGWITAVVAQGSLRMDADILRAAYRAAERGDLAELDAANRRGLAFRGTVELALESAQQGEAFLATCCAAWPDAFIEQWIGSKSPSPPFNPHPSAACAADSVPRMRGRVGEGDLKAPFGVCHSAVFGAVAARAGIALADALTGYLQAAAANLVAAGLRLAVVGQTDGQRILCALEPVVGAAAAAATVRDEADFGAATFAVDLASMAHEAQYTRLFRS